MSDALDETDENENPQSTDTDDETLGAESSENEETSTESETDDENNSDSENEEDLTGTETEEEGIQLIVEDGNCISGANSYVDLETATKYQTDRNRTAWLSLTEEEQKASIVRACQYVDATYTWKGRRKFQQQQMCFPRVEVYDIDGFEVEGIPTALVKAVLEACWYGYSTELFTVRTDEAGALKKDRKRVEGAVEVEKEFFSASETEVDYISKYAALDSILRGLYIPKNRKSVNAIACWRV